MDERIERINAAASFVRSRIGGLKPLAGIVLGSGLGKLADSIEDAIVIPYSEIPGFPLSTAIGHKGNFIVGTLGEKTVIAMQGRFHYYEGYPMELVTLPMRVMKVLGVEYLFVSNASGATNINFKVGDLVIIKDHINLLPNPLIGRNMDEFGVRFPDMTCAYDAHLVLKAKEIGEELGIDLKEGVYLASSGPSYETPAEVRFFQSIGADLVGMSTVPEVIVARHCGMKVFGISVATNVANAFNDIENLNDGEDVIKQADIASEKMCRLYAAMIKSL